VQKLDTFFSVEGLGAPLRSGSSSVLFSSPTSNTRRPLFLCFGAEGSAFGRTKMLREHHVVATGVQTKRMLRAYGYLPPILLLPTQKVTRYSTAAAKTLACYPNRYTPYLPPQFLSPSIHNHRHFEPTLTSPHFSTFSFRPTRVITLLIATHERNFPPLPSNPYGGPDHPVIDHDTTTRRTIRTRPQLSASAGPGWTL
jgi:hypothetical protein